ncbi:MAG: S8 family serine peptidase [bacterium]
MNNGIGSVGIAPYARLMIIRAGSGQNLTTNDVVQGISFATYNGAKIINASR